MLCPTIRPGEKITFSKMIQMTKRVDIHSKSHDQDQVDMYLEHLIAASAHHVQAHHLLLRAHAYKLHHLII